MKPTWTDFFFGLAFAYSRRSPDPSTQHGCIVVDPRNNHVVGTGYNGFLAGLPDEELPLTRPAKYPHMDHAEVNATASLRLDPWAVPGGLTAYITGFPCYDCARDLVRHNVLTWNVAARRGHTDESLDGRADTERVIRNKGVRVTNHRPNMNWLADSAWHDELRSLGFLPHQGTQGMSEEEGDRWLDDCLCRHVPFDFTICNVAPSKRHVRTKLGSFDVDTAQQFGTTEGVSGQFDLREDIEWVSLLGCLKPPRSSCEDKI